MFFGWRNQKNQKNIQKTKKTNDLEKIGVPWPGAAADPDLLPNHWFFWLFECVFGFFGFASKKALISLSNSMLFAKSISFA